MHLNRIRIENFFILDDIDIELGPKPFFITGQNNDEISSDSNGAGKSLFCNAIVWCLFDELLRKNVRKDDVIGGNGDYAMVQLEVVKDGLPITITRWRNHPERGHDVEILEDGEDVSQHKDSKAAIEKMLGINSSTVFYCAYTDKTTDPIVSLTPAKLKKAVAEVIDTQRFDAYLKEVRKRKRDCERRLETKVELLGEARSDLADKESALKSAQSDIDNFEKNKEARIKQLKAEKKGIEVDLKAKMKELDKISDFTQIREKLNEVDYDENVVIRGIQDLHSLHDALLEKTEQVEELNAEKKRLESKVNTLQRKTQHHQKRVDSIKAELSEVESSWKNIYQNKEGVCSYCGNHLASSESLDEIGTTLQERRDELEAKKIDAYTDLKAKSAELDKVRHILAEVDCKIDESHALIKLSRHVSKQVNVVKDKQNQIVEAGNKLDVKKKEIEKVRDEEPPKKLFKHLEKECDTLKTKEATLSGVVEDLNVEIEDYELLLDCIDYVKVSSFNGFIYTLLDLIEENLDEMTDGDFQVGLEDNKGELSFTFSQESKGGKFIPYSLFSTGEQVRISKATSVALEQMLDIGFVIDDEGLVGVDDAGLGHILDFVLEKNKGKTFFFAGHQKAMKDHFNMCDNIHIVKENGTSTAELR